MNNLLTPKQTRKQAILTTALEQRVVEQREIVSRILSGEDKRLLVIVGPCSIHDPVSALEYAEKLSVLSHQLQKQMVILMRVYVQKPRTELGWQGYFLDPAMDGKGDVNAGIIGSRELMKAVVSLGLGVATEYVSPIAESYLGDLVSWAAIGARSVESQLHRNFISGLAIPVGCKNSRHGSVDVAISALIAASTPQQYLGMNHDGQVDLIRTAGNPRCHVVLRGGENGPNYDEPNLVRVQDKLQQKNVSPAIVVDCSHDNSAGDYRQQMVVARAVINSRHRSKLNVRGIMLESHLLEGEQNLQDMRQLVYGQSVTDSCLGWEDTDLLLRELADRK